MSARYPDLEGSLRYYGLFFLWKKKVMAGCLARALLKKGLDKSINATARQKGEIKSPTNNKTSQVNHDFI